VNPSAASHPLPHPDQAARRLVLTGRVQGVGFRPFVYRTALDLGLTGWVRNDTGKVRVLAQGPEPQLDRFEDLLVRSAPPLARPVLSSSSAVPAEPLTDFSILASEAQGAPEIHVPPDLFTCDDCLAELMDPAERRHGYPFINCTQCGPRYTLITALPYDRTNTSMAGFPLCEACRAEYESPADRRFHAQPLACSECGPSLCFEQGTRTVTGNEQALSATLRALHDGGIVAVKGVGGYHLVCDASNASAVATLRRRKHRPHKPLAVMFPLRGADGLDSVREHATPDARECAALTDPARPIVLVRRRSGSPLAPELAPGLAELGAFLPYSPLHHRLLDAFGAPLVATSGNLSGEPVIIDNDEATRRLGAVCDAFLQHDRPIERPADDPVVRVIAGEPRLIRPGRGIAPIEFDAPAGSGVGPLLAVGGHMKNTVALSWDGRIVVSPHVGELDSPRSRSIFYKVINDLQHLYNVQCELIACDLHPGYASTRWARDSGLPLLRVQHHRAHASALAGEHPGVSRWLVFAWDGVGLGEDGELWGGEALFGAPGRWRRVAGFRPFTLTGGDRAGREPWRSAAAVMWEAGHRWEPGLPGLDIATAAWRSGMNAHRSSAAGRLFDAAAALVLERYTASFEGQGPMELEALACEGGEAVPMPLRPDGNGLLRSDWSALLPVLGDRSVPPQERASIFHESMARALLDQALRISESGAVQAVGLSGGVFQNRYLSERVATLLGEHGLDVRMHRQVPSNDGGLCYGQAIEAAAVLRGDGR